MSLINQMLRDLQKRQGDTPSAGLPGDTPATPPQRRLPVPLLASGAGLLGLMLLWWLAGALSGLFLPDQVVETAPVRGPVSVTSKTPAAIESAAVTSTEPREEQPSESAVVQVQPSAEQAVPAVTPSAPTQSVQPTAQPNKEPAAAPARKIVKQQPQPQPQLAVRRVTRTPKPAPLVRSIHPDALPGAILNSSRTLVNRPPPASQARTHRSQLTPYGAADAAFNEGMQAYLANRTSRAVAALQKTLDIYPGHLAARELLVDIYELTGRSGQAMHLLATGLEIAPDYMPFKKRYVRLLIDQGDLEAAVAVLLHAGLPAIDLDPEAHVLLASLYQRLGEPFLAAQTYRNLLVVWPQTGAFWIGLGSALEDQGLPGEARKAYQQALATHNLREDLAAHVRARLARS